MYEEIYAKSGDVDERDFFDKDGYLWIPFNKAETQSPSKVRYQRYIYIQCMCIHKISHLIFGLHMNTKKIMYFHQ